MPGSDHASASLSNCRSFAITPKRDGAELTFRFDPVPIGQPSGELRCCQTHKLDRQSLALTTFLSLSFFSIEPSDCNRRCAYNVASLHERGATLRDYRFPARKTAALRPILAAAVFVTDTTTIRRASLTIIKMLRHWAVHASFMAPLNPGKTKVYGRLVMDLIAPSFCRA